jgi:PKHD-type hydroxylase
MFISILKDVLGPAELTRVQEMLRDANFVDGHISGGDGPNKKNLELLPDGQTFIDVLKTIESALRDNLEFTFSAYPRYMTRPIVSRYDTGMYYREHTDFPIYNLMSTTKNSPLHRALAPLGSNYLRTDLSLTLFLTPLDSYEGGALCFDGPTGAIEHRLPAGCAVLYPTGAPHSVSKVTRGSRLASIFWIQSLFPLEPHRRAACDAFKLMRLVQSALPGSAEALLSETNFHNFLRLHGEV